MLGTKLGQNCDKWDKWDNWDKWDKSGTNGTNLGQMGQNQFFVTGVWRAQTPSVCDHAKKQRKFSNMVEARDPLVKIWDKTGTKLGQNWDKWDKTGTNGTNGTNGTKLGQMGQILGQMGQPGTNGNKTWNTPQEPKCWS